MPDYFHGYAVVGLVAVVGVLFAPVADEVGADEAGSAGDEGLQGASPS